MVSFRPLIELKLTSLVVSWCLLLISWLLIHFMKFFYVIMYISNWWKFGGPPAGKHLSRSSRHNSKFGSYFNTVWCLDFRSCSSLDLFYLDYFSFLGYFVLLWFISSKNFEILKWVERVQNEKCFLGVFKQSSHFFLGF